MRLSLDVHSSARCKACGQETSIDRLARDGARKVAPVTTDDASATGFEVELIGGCAFCGGGRFVVTVRLG